MLFPCGTLHTFAVTTDKLTAADGTAFIITAPMVEMSAEGIAVIAPFSGISMKRYPGIKLPIDIYQPDPAALDCHGILAADTTNCISWYMVLIAIFLCFLNKGIGFDHFHGKFHTGFYRDDTDTLFQQLPAQFHARDGIPHKSVQTGYQQNVIAFVLSEPDDLTETVTVFLRAVFYGAGGSGQNVTMLCYVAIQHFILCSYDGKTIIKMRLTAVFPYSHTHVASSLTDDQPVCGQRYIPCSYQQAPDQDETADDTADDEVERKGGNTAAKGSATGNNPKKHPMQTKGQTA